MIVEWFKAYMHISCYCHSDIERPLRIYKATTIAARFETLRREGRPISR